MLLHIENLKLPDLHTPETLVLTPNNRIMRKLLSAFECLQVKQGKEAWATPNIHPVSAWVKESLLDCQDMSCDVIGGQQILNSEQELVIWQRIISKAKNEALDGDQGFVGNIGQVVALAQQAYSLMSQWDVSFDDSQFQHSPEGGRFKEWALEFEEECRKNKYISPSKNCSLLISAIECGYIDAPKNVVLFAFDDISPVYQMLFDTLEAFGSKISTSEPIVENDSTVRVMLHDVDDEINTAALWARNIIENDKTATVGIVVPELTTYRNTVLKHFADVFEPQSILPDAPRYTLPFNISAGVSLSSVPVIADALKLLCLENRRLPIDDAISIVRSPFVGSSETEFSQRCVLEGKIRRLRKANVSISDIVSLAEKAPNFVDLINQFIDNTDNAKTKRPSQWAYSFNESLKLLGWPGERNLDSEEYQAVNHWTKVLDRMGEMDMLGGVTYSKGLELLRYLSSITVFQPKMGDSPVQILGALEAAGLQFSHLWVMGLSDDSWPSIPKPNPYLPLGLQRNPGSFKDGTLKSCMPHSTADRELQYAKRLTSRYLESATHIVMSSPKHDADRELRVSPLIINLELKEKTDLLLSGTESYDQLIFNSIDVETVIDEFSSTISPGGKITGGTGVVKSQACCPFMAFGKYRLNIKPFEPPRISLDPSDRGTIMHAVLQELWLNLKSRSALEDMKSDDLSLLVSSIASSVLQKYSQRIESLTKPVFFDIEKSRITNVVLEKLSVEIDRPDFKVVEIEKALEFDISGFKIDVKIDRIDKVGNGYIPIDYKTSETRISAWEGSRPDEPQVPLYASFYKENVIGAAFSQVRPGGNIMKGISDGVDVDINMKKSGKLGNCSLPNNWDDIKNQWTHVLSDLVSDYARGVSFADPKKGSQTCKTCDFSTVCRSSV
ncbi:MAG: PD-(D/E)XK nuclease family protein [Methylococcales bacterium]